MSLHSRNYIMARRGAGIANLQDVGIGTGDMDLDSVVEKGVYSVNCSHQVGIATSTEVGLSADRFPIRVVLAQSAAVVPQSTTDTVCSYWKITNAAGNSIPYSRKPIGSDLPIANLYAHFPDFDGYAWQICSALQNITLVHDHDSNVDTICDMLYGILQLINPTPEQYALIPTYVLQISDLCLAANRVPYIRIAQNAYLKFEPHGREHIAIGGMSANRVAVTETLACIAVNHRRLKSRYDVLNDGVVTLAAYSVANMFRMGMYENYEHREYYTVIATPSATDPKQLIVQEVRNPRGAPPLADITQNQVIDINEVKVKPQLVELGNSMVMGSGLMHYMFNHTTGGNVVTGTLLTILAMYQFITSDMPNDMQVQITSLLYEALHPVNKRGVANVMFKNSKVTTHGRCATAPRCEAISLDSFMTIRSNPYPAGSHKAVVCLQALRRVLQAGLGMFLPWADQLNTCLEICKDVLKSGAKAHIGASYYTGDHPVVQPSSLDIYMPELAQFVHTYNKGDSLAMSPHLGDDVAKKSNMNWQNLLRDLKAKDVSATPAETVRTFLSTSGSVHFAFDPSNAETWGKAVSDAKVVLTTIDTILI